MRGLAVFALVGAVCATAFSWTPVAAQSANAGSVPDALPALVSGVIGSGDNLSLQLKPSNGPAPRILAVGQVFEDGWVLTALTPTAATLDKKGVTRMIGLNPTGALDDRPATAPPSRVEVNLSPDERSILSGIVAGGEMDRPGFTAWDGTTPFAGLTFAETQRYLLDEVKFRAAAATFGATPPPSSDGVLRPLAPPRPLPTPEQIRALIGTAFDEYMGLSAKRATGQPAGAPPS